MLVEGYKDMYRKNKQQFINEFFTVERIENAKKSNAPKAGLDFQKYNLERDKLAAILDDIQTDIILEMMRIILFVEKKKWHSLAYSYFLKIPKLVNQIHRVSIQSNKESYRIDLEQSRVDLHERKQFFSDDEDSDYKKLGWFLTGACNIPELKALRDLNIIDDEDVCNYVRVTHLAAIDELLAENKQN